MDILRRTLANQFIIKMTLPLPGINVSASHTNPNSLYVGFAFLFSEFESLSSIKGSYVHLMHLIERDGSRAGARSRTLGMAAAGSLTDPLGIGMNPSTPSARRGVVGFGFSGFGADRYEDGESMLVRGVSWLLELFTAAVALGRVGALNTEELELACELADPPALSVSPWSDSASSVKVRAASGPVPFVCDLDAKPE